MRIKKIRKKIEKKIEADWNRRMEVKLVFYRFLLNLSLTEHDPELYFWLGSDDFVNLT